MPALVAGQRLACTALNELGAGSELRHPAGARVAGFVDGSTEKLPERISAVMRA